MDKYLIEDKIIFTAGIILPSGDGTQYIGKMIDRNHSSYGHLIFCRNANIILNSHKYVVQYNYKTYYILTYSKVVDNL